MSPSDAAPSIPRTVTANGQRFCVQTFGRPEDPPLLLVAGLGAQMILWPDELVTLLARGGRHVIRFDNRDVGLSSKTAGDVPDIPALWARAASGTPVGAADVAYTLSDMAADAAGLLDALDIERADIVGSSMGGMIAQHLAFEHSQRVRTVTSIMSTTGDPAVGQSRPEALGTLLTPPPPGREAVIEHGVANSRAISGPLWNEDDARQRATASYDRMFHPLGVAFQLAAIMASGDRTSRLAGVEAPFLVIHGRADPLIDLSGGQATAEAVPRADLVVLHAMGHDLPRPLLGRIAAAVLAFTS